MRMLSKHKGSVQTATCTSIRLFTANSGTKKNRGAPGLIRLGQTIHRQTRTFPMILSWTVYTPSGAGRRVSSDRPSFSSLSRLKTLLKLFSLTKTRFISMITFLKETCRAKRTVHECRFSYGKIGREIQPPSLAIDREGVWTAQKTK